MPRWCPGILATSSGSVRFASSHDGKSDARNDRKSTSPFQQRLRYIQKMPTKLNKAASFAASRSSSKRVASHTPNRQSKRARSTVRRSYAESESDGGAPSDKDLAVQSDYEVEGAADPSSESAADEVNSEQDAKDTRGGSARRAVLPARRKKNEDGELWRTDAKLQLGTQVIIKKPKAREAGKTPYTDDTIHPNTMLFLRDLAAHNDRQWLKGESFACTAFSRAPIIGNC